MTKAGVAQSRMKSGSLRPARLAKRFLLFCSAMAVAENIPIVHVKDSPKMPLF